MPLPHYQGRGIKKYVRKRKIKNLFLRWEIIEEKLKLEYDNITK